MSARDKIHSAVKNALAKDGWSIADDPLQLTFCDIKLQVDLGAEKLLAAQKGERKIAVEVKSFVSASAVSELHQVVGQFLNYEQALEECEPGRTLYLAVPLDVYRVFFEQPYAQSVTRRRGIRMIVVSTEKEEVVLWTS